MADQILVIGSAGLVGGALMRAFSRRGIPALGSGGVACVLGGGRRLDISDESGVAGLLKEIGPKTVALTAANPHVDFCELHPAETRRVNVAGSLNVARACAQACARLVFFSSDYVFDGVKGVYGEDDAPCPINEYGRQKAEVEKAVLESAPGNIVVRTSGVYGWQNSPKNFVLQVLARLKAGENFPVNAEVRYNPTYVENLAEITADLMGLGQGGLYHVVGADRILRIEFAKLAARVFGLDQSLIKAVAGGEFKAPAPRPRESSLKTAKVQGLVSTPLWGACRGLEHMKAAGSALTGL